MAITAVLPDQVLANGASDGDLLIVQADGSVAFETPAGGGGGIGGSTGATDNAVLRADGTDGDTLQGSAMYPHQCNQPAAPCCLWPQCCRRFRHHLREARTPQNHQPALSTDHHRWHRLRVLDLEGLR